MPVGPLPRAVSSRLTKDMWFSTIAVKSAYSTCTRSIVPQAWGLMLLRNSHNAGTSQQLKSPSAVDCVDEGPYPEEVEERPDHVILPGLALPAAAAVSPAVVVGVAGHGEALLERLGLDAREVRPRHTAHLAPDALARIPGAQRVRDRVSASRAWDAPVLWWVCVGLVGGQVCVQWCAHVSRSSRQLSRLAASTM